MNRCQIRLINGSLWLLFLVPLATFSLQAISLPTMNDVRFWLNGEQTKAIEDQYDDSFVLKNWSINLWAAFSYSLLGEGQPGVVIGKDEWLLTKEEYFWPKNAETRLEQSTLEIAQTFQKLRSQGLSVELILLPTKTEIYADKLTQPSPQQMHNLYDHVLYLLSQQGVTALDLRPILLNSRRDGEAFLHTDTHWTPLGAEHTAKAITQHAGWFNDNQLYKTENEGFTEYRGDLLNYIPVSPHMTVFGPRPDNLAIATTQSVQPTKSDDLFAEEQPLSQVLIGTSYSANEKWNFAGALKQYTGRDLLNLAEVGKGPFIPMRQWLQNDGDKQPGLQRVIWEIPVRYLLQEAEPVKTLSESLSNKG
jgi:alginate O-acetyltransferase complex protein AlgJ